MITFTTCSSNFCEFYVLDKSNLLKASGLILVNFMDYVYNSALINKEQETCFFLLGFIQYIGHLFVNLNNGDFRYDQRGQRTDGRHSGLRCCLRR